MKARRAPRRHRQERRAVVQRGAARGLRERRAANIALDELLRSAGRRRRAPAAPSGTREIGSGQTGPRARSATSSRLMARSCGWASRLAGVARSRPRTRPRSRPSARRAGCSGVHCVPNAGQSCGFLSPAGSGRAMHSGDSCAVTSWSTSKRCSASKAGVRSAQPEPLPRDHADAAPLAVADLEDLRTAAAAPAGLPSRRHGARVLVLHLGAACLELPAPPCQIPCSRSSGSKPVTTIGTR